jgi:CheY-like chemotaxis protein
VGARAIDARNADLPRTVLVVEDEVLIRWVIAEHLRECGYRVIEAGNGDEAIEILRRTALTIHVVFSDVRMPGTTDGFALAQWVRTAAGHQGHPDVRDREGRRCRRRVVLRSSRGPQAI